MNDILGWSAKYSMDDRTPTIVTKVVVYLWMIILIS